MLLHGGMRDVAGYCLITSVETDVKIEYNTYQCCHCQAHFTREVGKGPKAMCLMCKAPTCGKKPCDRCIPFEAKLEAWEGTRRFWKEIDLNIPNWTRRG